MLIYFEKLSMQCNIRIYSWQGRSCWADPAREPWEPCAPWAYGMGQGTWIMEVLDALDIWHTKLQMANGKQLMWVKKSTNHPPYFTIFICGIVTIPKWIVYYCFTHIRQTIPSFRTCRSDKLRGGYSQVRHWAQVLPDSSVGNGEHSKRNLFSHGLRRLLVISCDIMFDIALHCILMFVFDSQPLQ
jgi:hypothetical protein